MLMNARMRLRIPLVLIMSTLKNGILHLTQRDASSITMATLEALRPRNQQPAGSITVMEVQAQVATALENLHMLRVFAVPLNG